MSQRLDDLAAQARDGSFPSDYARFEWLQEQLSALAFQWTHPVDPMRAMLARYANAPSATPGRPLYEGWIEAAGRIAESISDPDDNLFGVLIAGEVWALGLHYSLEDMTRFLRRLSAIPSDVPATDDPSQNAYQLYEHLLNRLMEADAMLRGDLEGDEIVECEWSENADTLADAIALLRSALVETSEALESDEDRSMGAEEIDELVEWSGHFLWAAHHARQAGIPLNELDEFVTSFTSVWVKIFRALIRDKTLVPGVLDAISGVYVDEDLIVADGPRLVEAYRTIIPTPDCTLMDYLTNALSANTLDA